MSTDRKVRSIFEEDYELLRELAFVQRKRIPEIFDEMAIYYEKLLSDNVLLDELLRKKEVRTSKAATNKSVKIPSEFNENLLSKATELNTNAKRLISVLIQDYYNRKKS